jgi:hypothetical protein
VEVVANRERGEVRTNGVTESTFNYLRSQASCFIPISVCDCTCHESRLPKAGSARIAPSALVLGSNPGGLQSVLIVRKVLSAGSQYSDHQPTLCVSARILENAVNALVDSYNETRNRSNIAELISSLRCPYMEAIQRRT